MSLSSNVIEGRKKAMSLNRETTYHRQSFLERAPRRLLECYREILEPSDGRSKTRDDYLMEIGQILATCNLLAGDVWVKRQVYQVMVWLMMEGYLFCSSRRPETNVRKSTFHFKRITKSRRYVTVEGQVSYWSEDPTMRGSSYV